MFETSQQEPSGHDTRVIGGVIVVLMAALGVLYYFYIHTAPPAATQTTPPAAEISGGGAPAADADFRRDLVVQRPNLARDQTQTMSVWNFQIQNRSRTTGYRNLKYTTTYYDGANNVIHTGSGSISDEVVPGDLRSVSNLNDGLYPLNTVRYEIDISAADGYTP